MFGLSGLVGHLAYVHLTQGMTGAAEIDVLSITSYAGSKASTSGADNT
eukprot:SAG31_NODE_187_length_20848_cov_22.521953_17_plen_48_part_00